jgi:hypothetical protein
MRALRLILVLLGLPLLAAACSRPYDRGVIAAEPGQSTTVPFDGVSDLIAQAKAGNRTASFIWTHGMCSHDATWAADRTQRIITALGATGTITADPVQDGQLAFARAAITAPAGTIDGTFIIWSPMTQVWKQGLAFDAPGADPDNSFPYTRAELNNTLKIGLMNDCLADAVVYAGRHGDAIRAAMKAALCTALGGATTPASGACDLGAADLEKPLAIITESLGSKFLFDAVRTLWLEAPSAPSGRQALAQRLTSIRAIYLVANQIPLLDIASPLPGEPVAPPDAARLAARAQPAASSLEGFLQILREARGQSGAAGARVSAAALTPPTVVAFTDPNDLLSYRLLPRGLDLAGAQLVNVIVSNDDTWFGFLERPDTAHCGYAWNRKVIGLIANGYRPDAPIPEAPALASGQCL